VRRDFFNESRNDGQGVYGIGGRGDRWCYQDAIMEMRGRNGKWLRAGNGRTVWVVGVDMVL